MIKHIFLVVAFLWVSISTAQNATYYRLHPKVLQQALQACPQKQPKNVTCKQLNAIALKVNSAAYELRLSPQFYGKKILILQQTIAKQEQILKIKPNQPNIQISLSENKQQLQERLAIVKWLESPEA